MADQDETQSLHDTRAGGERAWLLVLRGGSVEAHALPAEGTVSIGRSSQCDVVLEEPSVSRRHASLELGPPLRVHNLRSANGVRLRHRTLAVGESGTFEPGEVIQIGPVLVVVQHGSAYLPPAGPGHRKFFDGADGDEAAGLEELVIRDPTTKRVYDLAAKVARGEINLLLFGETGVGKEVIARAVHRRSPRSDGPFIQVNCATLTTSLAEAELFGYERGAFTGADRTKAGLLEAADGGTLFLDEVGELSLEVQAKLLRVLEERSVRRLGSTSQRPVDVRFVAATNRDLQLEVREGRFRSDLYFRLNGIGILVPALRDRPADIEPLARHFLHRAGHPGALGPDALDWLQRHRWPGNVRELANLMERVALLERGAAISAAHLEQLAGDVGGSWSSAPAASHSASSPPPDASTHHVPAQQEERPSLHDELKRLERDRILEALEACGGNQTRAAQLLGISRRKLIDRIEAYGIPRPRKS